jgi:hypothetical protein
MRVFCSKLPLRRLQYWDSKAKQMEEADVANAQDSAALDEEGDGAQIAGSTGSDVNDN